MGKEEETKGKEESRWCRRCGEEEDASERLGRDGENRNALLIARQGRKK